KIQDWLGDWYPAEVEGSDCKSIEEIGKGQKCFLKLGDYSYDSVKFALIDKDNRVSSEPINYQHSYIRSIRFTGGTLSGQELHFSPELNTLIGIRGSGKSSILEALRYVLDIKFGDNAGDKKYKQDLVGFTLGSGGTVEIDAINRHCQPYTIRHTWEEKYSEVLIDGKLQPGVSIRETVLHKPIYFGQKDLSNTGEGFEKDLVDKLLGSKLGDIRRSISMQKEKVAEAVDRLIKVSNAHDMVNEQTKIKQDTEHQLKVYTEYGFEEKLQKQLDFANDARTIDKGIQLTNSFVTNIESLLAQHEDDLRNLKGYNSKNNDALFVNFYKNYDSYISFVDYVKKWLVEEKDIKNSLSAFQNELSTIREGMVEEFAETKRKLSEELKSSDTQNISSDEFLKLKNALASANQLLSVLKNQEDQKNILQNQLLVELQKLNVYWLEEFTMIKTELDKVGSGKSSISITSGYKEDKAAFISFMKDMFKGSGIRETTYQGIVDQYVDFVSIYKDFKNAKKYFGSNPHILSDLFIENLKILLTYKTPNKFTILYRGKELQHHSLGQRSSALILFVLSQEDNDVIIVDQPEDDLDNQTIYEDVIKLICQIKPKVQFIFATHNPNIPVLGDAEQVLACSFTDEKVTVCAGSVDNPCTQKTIVNIMEGGKEAFDRRKEIYRIWKS
ncbi:MAG: histidinol-phosphatase, partial [Caldisericia bacterium]|nr:histidinol-phosphatase [Caldisericia bacterium]